MSSILYKKHNYINKDINIIKNTSIIEFDIKSAGLNIIYKLNLIDKEQYDALLNMEKNTRNIVIGEWLRDNPNVNLLMMDEFVRIRKLFFEINEIEDINVLSIKKDAIFLVDMKPKNLNIDGYEFVMKNKYTHYLLLDRNKEFYYNKMSSVLDVKGYGKEIRERQKDYFFKLIIDLFKCEKDKNKAFRLLIEFKNNFLNKDLDINYYRDLNTNLYIFSLGGLTYTMEEVPENMKDYIDFTNNSIFLNNIISIFLT